MKFFLTCLLCAAIALIPLTQKRASAQQINKQGTCAVTAMAPFGIAFAIDSRVTETNRDGTIISQYEGCKLLLARPTILIAGIGLEDTSGIAGHWNSLDEAAKALQSLPPNPSASEVNSWSKNWANTLIRHFRNGHETPHRVGEVADILFLTKLDGKPFHQRTIVTWDGHKFIQLTDGNFLDQSRPGFHYAGACRSFVNTNDGEGGRLRPAFQRTPVEHARFEHWGHRKDLAKSVDDLADAVYGIMKVSTDMDVRIEGSRAVIGPPYAYAQWGDNAQSWTVDLNERCKEIVKTR